MINLWCFTSLKMSTGTIKNSQGHHLKIKSSYDIGILLK